MSEMIERVAKAVYLRWNFSSMDECLAVARAAIEAMREPTLEAIDVAGLATGYSRDHTLTIYQHVIDAALKDGP